MEAEEKKILEENLEISRQSLKILKGIRRGNRLAMIFKVLYWLVILGIVAGVYYFVEPYVKSALGTIQQVQGALPGNQKTNGTQDTLPDLLKNLPPNLLKQLQDIFKTK